MPGCALRVSRIDPRKGLSVFPGAFALLEAGRDVRPTSSGPPSDSPARTSEPPSSRGRDPGVAGPTALPGPCRLIDLMTRYRDYDLFLLPTRPGEGIPRVLLEAMAAGLPVVTTDVAGIPCLTDGHNGLLVHASIDAVAAAIARLIDDAALRQRIIRGGLETARAHTLDRQAQAMIDAHRRALASRPVAGGARGDDGRVKRVVFVAPSLHGGGAERAAVTVLNALDASRYERSVSCSP